MAVNVSDEQIDFICSDLNEHQKLIAPPGSGKTEVVINRVLYMLNQGVRPHQILVAMFNRDARTEVLTRLAENGLKTQREQPLVRTYHGLGKKLCESLVKAQIRELLVNEFTSF